MMHLPPPCEPQVEDQPGKLFPDCSERPVAGSWIPNKLGSSSNCQTGNPVQTEPPSRHPSATSAARSTPYFSIRAPGPVPRPRMWVAAKCGPPRTSVVCAFFHPQILRGSKWYVPLNSAQGRGRGQARVCVVRSPGPRSWIFSPSF
ncbi:hypothetical protein ASPBRDRAFT_231719 [Aspergillus brasiliensis CBS 101740]|uniref:Uncharacterized protein n=1 Tax=Aspergillus brasiliensis (strain CBS 101740 / IMI 381727 / IBT 21946) TaxID=767769 RepID=A0A1L9V010_ASPBC|nr:hypothetical protein ASPBRDRAFT_231719 [Aspergillus brasiliensis CBS 101740]